MSKKISTLLSKEANLVYFSLQIQYSHNRKLKIPYSVTNRPSGYSGDSLQKQSSITRAARDATATQERGISLYLILMLNLQIRKPTLSKIWSLEAR